MIHSATRNVLWRTWACLALAVVGIAPAQATVMTEGCATNVSCTLGDLVGGGKLTVDDKIFDDWTVEDLSTNPVLFESIEVAGRDDQPLNPGLTFDAGDVLTAFGFDLIDLLVTFTVSTVDQSPRIKDSSTTINSFEFAPADNDGFIKIQVDILDPGNSLLGSQFVEVGVDPEVPEDSTVFAPQSSIFVETFVNVTGGFNIDDSASLQSFTQRFSQTGISEPATLLLLALGVGALAFLGRVRPVR